VRAMRRLYVDIERRLSVLVADVGRCIAGQIPYVKSEYDI